MQNNFNNSIYWKSYSTSDLVTLRAKLGYVGVSRGQFKAPRVIQGSLSFLSSQGSVMSVSGRAEFENIMMVILKQA